MNKSATFENSVSLSAHYGAYCILYNMMVRFAVKLNLFQE